VEVTAEEEAMGAEAWGVDSEAEDSAAADSEAEDSGEEDSVVVMDSAEMGSVAEEDKTHQQRKEPAAGSMEAEGSEDSEDSADSADSVVDEEAVDVPSQKFASM
jgi:hypothetical protein